MAERDLSHSVAAMLRLAGPQPTNVAVQYPGTEEATVTIAVRSCVMYLRTRVAAESVAGIWRRAGSEAPGLPRRLRIAEAPHQPFDAAEPSVVVHTRGRPPGFVQLHREPGTTTYLHVQIGGLTLFLRDLRAFESVAGAFHRATQLGVQHLPEFDLRQVPVTRHQTPALAGQAAAGARDHLEQIARHPARIAAASLSQLENRLAAVVDPLQSALTATRALREQNGRDAHAQHDAPEQPPADPDLRQDAKRQFGHRTPGRRHQPEQHEQPIRHPDQIEHRRGGQAR